MFSSLMSNSKDAMQRKVNKLRLKFGAGGYALGSMAGYYYVCKEGQKFAWKMLEKNNLIQS